MVFLCGRAGCKDDVMPKEHKETPTTKLQSSQQPLTQWSLQSFLPPPHLRCFSEERHLLVLLEKVWWFKQFGPFCFPLQNLIGNAEACQCNTHQLWRLKKPTPNIIPAVPESLVLCCTIFKLLAHDGARRGGHVVRGVLLGVGGRDDGHQVVSVRGVYLQIRRKMLAWFG